MLSWKFQLHSSYGSKVIITWILSKISQNCLLPAARFFQIWCQRTCQGKKTVTVNVGPHRVFHPNEPFLPSEKCIFRSTRELFGEVWNKYQSSKLLLILSTSYVNILLILIQLLYNSRFYSKLYFKNVL